MKNALGQKVHSYCILDSDYHTEGQKATKLEEANTHGVRLHIWSKKELENYLLVPSAIARYISNRVHKGEGPAEREVLTALDQIAEDAKDDITDSIASELQREDRKLDLKGARKKAQKHVDSLWADWDTRSTILSGKHALSKLSARSQENHSVSLNPRQIAATLQSHEIEREVRSVLTAIERLTAMPKH